MNNANKPKLIPRFPLMNAWGCMFGLVMLVLGLASGGLIMIYALPMLWNYDAELTAAWSDIHQMGTAQSAFSRALDATLQAQNAQGTQMALLLDATQAAQYQSALLTQAALDNNQALLNQTATQSQRFIFATMTAQAVRSEQERTQVALSYQATQVALQQNATQVQLDFQKTQAALGANTSSQSFPNLSGTAEVPVVIATNQIQIFNSQSVAVEATPSPTRPAAASTPVPVVPFVAASDTPLPFVTATSLTPVLLPPTNTPSPTSIGAVAQSVPAAMDESFAQGVDLALWEVSGNFDWQAGGGGIKALRSGAWLITRDSYSGDYQVVVTFTPALVDKADYVFLLNVDNETGLTLTLNSQALNVRQVSLAVQNGDTLASQAVNVPLTGTSHLTITFNNGQITTVLNNQEILTVSPARMPEAGTVGVQFPKDTVLRHIEVTPS